MKKTGHKRWKLLFNFKTAVVISLLLSVLSGTLLGLLVSAAPPDAWPNCNWNCTANDLQITRLWLSGDNTTGNPLPPCNTGDLVTAYIWAEIDNGTGTDRYAAWLIFDLYIGGVQSGPRVVECVADTILSGTTMLPISDQINWTCGQEVELKGPSVPGEGPVISWSTNVESCLDTPKCASRTAQCFGTIPLIVAVPLAVGFTSDSPQCYCTNINFTDTTKGGVEPYTYSWDFGDGSDPSTEQNPSHHYAEAGTYNVTLTVTDCDTPPNSDSETKPVTVYPSPSVTLSGTASFCEGGSTTITANVSGGTPPYSYDWSASTAPGSASDGTYTATDTGTVVVTVTDANLCTDSDSVAVTENPAPTVNITPDGGELTCATTFILLTADTSASLCSVTSYQWYKDGAELPGETGSTLNITAPGTYKVEVECDNGCTANDTVAVTQDIEAPLVDAGPDQELTCGVTSVLLNAAVSGGTTPYTYSWKNSSNVEVGTTEDINVSSPDTYTLTVTGGNGCSSSDSVVVTQDIEAPLVDAGPDQELTCGVTSVLLNAAVSGGTTPYTYSWKNSSQLTESDNSQCQRFECRSLHPHRHQGWLHQRSCHYYSGS